MIWLSLLGSDLIVSLIKAHVDRARPDQAEALLPASGYSFPSGHTFSSLAFYGLLGVMMLLSMKPGAARLAMITGIVAISGLVGFSRIYVGAHWPTDVLGSWLLGTAWLCLLSMVLAGNIGRWRQGGSRKGMLAFGLAIFCLWSAAIIALAIFDPAVRGGGSVGEAPVSGTSSLLDRGRIDNKMDSNIVVPASTEAAVATRVIEGVAVI
jgi:hypothetical protein